MKDKGNTPKMSPHEVLGEDWAAAERARNGTKRYVDGFHNSVPDKGEGESEINAEVRIDIQRAVESSHFTPREMEIFQELFLKDVSQRKAAKSLGISYERVQELEKNILEKILRTLKRTGNKPISFER